jgi:hypothetical protein
VSSGDEPNWYDEQSVLVAAGVAALIPVALQSTTTTTTTTTVFPFPTGGF